MKYLIILLLLSSCSLSKQDIILQSVANTLIVYDWMQTKEFRKQGMKEDNPVLGNEPSQEKVDTYIGLGLIASNVVTVLLPSEYRPVWQLNLIFAEVNAVHHNYRVGVRIGYGL